MIKFRMYYDKDKETAWLNEMVAQGWAMTGFFAGFYRFEQCEPGEYTYQIDFGDKFFNISNGYREFMEDMGVQIVQKWGFWIILRKLASEGEFKLYTDVDSSIEHYTKIRTMFKIGTIIELICFFVEMWCAMQGNKMAIWMMFFIMILVFVLMKAAFKTNYIIAELKERKGEVVKCGFGKGKVSPLLPCGMLINSCAVLAKESVAISPTIIMLFQVIAIILMLVGLYRLRSAYKEEC